ncbi:MAG: energy-coupling factor transporter ATPase [Saccharofermentanales bacterium]
MPPFIELNGVSFEYKISGLESLTAVDNVSMSIERGSHVAILGRNGSGKSTLARLINGLEIPSAGTITVDGLLHDGAANSLEIRRKCGIVFQNPDNQIIGTTVEEDVAFGPENLGVPREEMIIRIDKALAAVGLSDKKKTAPHLLSGGQKQKLAIAGILAMEPECFILDEATSMLDPATRKEFIALITQLVRNRGLTILNITHDMEEAVLADYVYIMSEGGIVKEGTPVDVFDDLPLLRLQGLDVPVHIEIAQLIAELTGVSRIRGAAFTMDGARSEIRRLCSASGKDMARNYGAKHGSAGSVKSAGACVIPASEPATSGETVLDVEALSYTYSRETVFANDALKDVTFSIGKGELFGIVGQTGSGKSTLVQHFNGLLRPQTGKVTVLGFDTARKEGIKEIRKHAGLLFQYPEHQLFEETVYKDVAFGPKCLGMSESEIHDAVVEALAIVGLGEEFQSKSPFELSGGQKRRVAIAGIVAMKPDVLILDEPAAGLDPAGRDEILSFVKSLSDAGKTVILVSHNMDDIARMTDRVLVLRGGELKICASPHVLFAESCDVAAYGISYPVISDFMRHMKEQLPTLKHQHFTPEGCAEDILEAVFGIGGGFIG